MHNSHYYSWTSAKSFQKWCKTKWKPRAKNRMPIMLNMSRRRMHNGTTFINISIYIPLMPYSHKPHTAVKVCMGMYNGTGHLSWQSVRPTSIFTVAWSCAHKESIGHGFVVLQHWTYHVLWMLGLKTDVYTKENNSCFLPNLSLVSINIIYIKL